jgi:putative ABC transport system substrate-binding protein
VPRIGLLAWSSCESPILLRGLTDLGYKPGETLMIECRKANGSHDGLPKAAAELVKLGVDVIVAGAHPMAAAAHKATNKIPIVSILSGDPVASGLARSLANPGGNLTGVSYYATELTAKRLELLMEAKPELAMIDVLANPVASDLPFERDTKRAAEKLGVAVRFHQIEKPADLTEAFLSIKTDKGEAVFVLPDIMLASEAKRIAALALERRIPTMAWGLWFTKAGCLMAYSAKYGDLMYRLAYYVDRILKGAKPGDLPIEQPMKFDLSINLKTAKTLGLEMPQTLLVRADEIIK